MSDLSKEALAFGARLLIWPALLHVHIDFKTSWEKAARTPEYSFLHKQ